MNWVSDLWDGFVVTLELSAIVIGIALPLSLVVAALSIGPSKSGKVFAGAFVDIFRSVPHLALMIFLYYGIGTRAISPIWLAAVGLAVVEAGYLSEIYRAALNSIGRGQWEAGYSLGLSWFSTVRLIVVPTAAVSAVPGTINVITVIIKDTSLAALVAVSEVTLHANQLASLTFQPLAVYGLLAAFYVALILPVTLLGDWLERSLTRKFHPNPQRSHRELMKIGRTRGPWAFGALLPGMGPMRKLPPA